MLQELFANEAMETSEVYSKHTYNHQFVTDYNIDYTNPTNDINNNIHIKQVDLYFTLQDLQPSLTWSNIEYENESLADTTTATTISLSDKTSVSSETTISEYYDVVHSLLDDSEQGLICEETGFSQYPYNTVQNDYIHYSTTATDGSDHSVSNYDKGHSGLANVPISMMDDSYYRVAPLLMANISVDIFDEIYDF
jgi:hypothetical protein